MDRAILPKIELVDADTQIEQPRPAPCRPFDTEIAVFDRGRDDEKVNEFRTPTGVKIAFQPGDRKADRGPEAGNARTLANFGAEFDRIDHVCGIA